MRHEQRAIIGDEDQALDDLDDGRAERSGGFGSGACAVGT